LPRLCSGADTAAHGTVDKSQHRAGVLAIRFFGTHEEYDQINAETV
jgi:mRNA-degrading endonuclease HigB of HigAB toxin-antitoxin module